MWAGVRAGHIGRIPAYKPLWAILAGKKYKLYLPGALSSIVLLKLLGYLYTQSQSHSIISLAFLNYR